jgi:hypothetical protein
MLRVGKLARAGRRLQLRATAIPVQTNRLASQLWDEVARLDLGASRPGEAGAPAPLPSIGLLLGQSAEAVGTLNKSIGTITVAGAGTVAVDGALNKSIGTIDRALAGAVAVSAYLGNAGEAPIGNITLAAVGGIGQVGSLSASIGTITVAGTGTVTVGATLSKSIGAITLATTGGPAVVGTLGKSIGSVLLAGSGQVDSGIASTEAPAPLPSLSLVMYQTNTIVAVLNKSIGTIGLAATGDVPIDERPAYDFGDTAPAAPLYYPWARDFAWVQADTTNRADAGGITAVVGGSIGLVTLEGDAAVDVSATLSKSIGAITAAGAASIGTVASVDKTIGTITVAGLGNVTAAFVANVDRPVGTITVVATGGPVAGGELAAGIGAITLDSFTDITGGDCVGVLNKSIGQIMLATTGGPAVVGGLAMPVGDIVVSGVASALTGTVAVLNKSIGLIDLDAAGSVVVYELGVRRRRTARAGERRIGSRQARAAERQIEGALVE